MKMKVAPHFFAMVIEIVAYNTVQQSIGYSYNNNNHDNITYDDDAKTPPRPAKAIGRSIYHSLVELTDFGPLLFQCLVDPFGTIRANAPHLIPSFLPPFLPWGWGRGRGFSGRKKFSPKDDIPDLGGKVILVTGGQYSVLSRKPHIQLVINHLSSIIYRLPSTLYPPSPKSHVPWIIEYIFIGHR